MEEFNLNAAYLWGGSIVIVTIIMAWVVTRPRFVWVVASFGSSQSCLDSMKLAEGKIRARVEKRAAWIASFKARRNERWAEKAVKAWGESQAKILARKLVEKDAAEQRNAEIEAKAWIKSAGGGYGRAVDAALVEDIAVLKESVAILMARLEKAENMNSRNAAKSVDLVRAEQAKHRDLIHDLECAEIWGGGSCPNPGTCKHYY